MTWVNLKQLYGVGGITKGCEKTFWSDRLFIILIMLMVSQVYNTYVRTYQYI